MLKRFKKLSRSKRLVLAAAVLGFVAVGLSGGCIAYRRPPAFNAEERALLQSAPLPYSVTVAWWDEATKTGQNPEAYGGALAQLVTASGAFSRSRYERSSMPTGQDLVATSTGLYCNTAIIPLLSIISIGVIPTIFQDEHCEGMLLRRLRASRKAKACRSRSATRGWSSWAGWPSWLARYQAGRMARRTPIRDLPSASGSR